MPRAHRSALSKFCLGVAYIRVETGRYERLTVTGGICFHCKTCVEDELHVLLDCPLYNELCLRSFQTLQDNGIIMQEKLPMAQFTFILNNMDENLIRMYAEYCFEILTKRIK